MSDDKTIDWSDLEARARAVRKNAHAPYSKYQVGSALLVRSGAVFVGCNIENASYGLTLCAERSAIAQMVSAGASDPIALVVVTRGPKPGSPCGACRQVLAEVATDDLPIRLIVEDEAGPTAETTLGVLLPNAFRKDSL